MGAGGGRGVREAACCEEGGEGFRKQPVAGGGGVRTVALHTLSRRSSVPIPCTPVRIALIFSIRFSSVSCHPPPASQQLASSHLPYTWQSTVTTIYRSCCAMLPANVRACFASSALSPPPIRRVTRSSESRSSVGSLDSAAAGCCQSRHADIVGQQQGASIMQQHVACSSK